MNSYCKTSLIPNIDLSLHQTNTDSICNYETETKNLSNSSNIQESSSNQNVCAHCGFETYEPERVTNVKSSNTHTNTQYLPSKEADLKDKRMLFQSYDEETSQWIFCDICRKWFHANCVDIQQYEMPLIDKYHCPSCKFEHGESILKIKRLIHRYSFDDESQRALPIQIGSEAWTNNFKNEYRKIPEVPLETIDIYKNGCELMQNFNFSSIWTKPIKVLNSKGLGLKMPEDPYFDVLDVIKLLGGHIFVDTIDVFAQQTYTMSLDRFYGLWKKRVRDRLYNILSLEFSGTKLADIVRSPSIVRELSWVRRFWPKEEQSYGNKDTFDDIYTFTENPSWQNYFGQANESEHQHESSRPHVENFCLMGMRGSYTDFHIDFGGSSVWYHVFKGSKIFFIAPPTSENLDAFLKWQKDKLRSEIFFGDLLPNGSKLYRLHVDERETLLLPSGWIHSVYTPEDSIVFGGNFLHSLNVSMQLKVYEMEIVVDTDERFKFPFFELCNIYAAKIIAESLKDCTECGQLADKYQIDSATLLLQMCSKWLRKNDKFSIFGGALKQLERQLGRQALLQRRIRSHAIDTPLTANVTDLKNTSKHTEQEIQDLDSSWDQDDFDEHGLDDDCDLVENSNIQSNDDNETERVYKQTDIQDKFMDERASTSARYDSNHDKISEVDPDGPIRLKIKLSCWHRKADIEKSQIEEDLFDDEAETSMDIGAMFEGRSTHGRQFRPTSRITTLGENPMSVNNKHNDVEFVPETSSIISKTTGRRDFISQFTLEERRQIELAGKAAEDDYKNELFFPIRRQKRKTKTTASPSQDVFQQTLSTSSNKAESVIEKKPKKSSVTSSRERLAKKLGLMRKK